MFFVVALLAAPVAHGQTAARYEAVFSDGTRIDGDKVSGWGEHPGSPRLDNTALFDAKRPLRWLRNRGLKVWRPGLGDAYIEFVGGDRIVGRIVGVGAAAGPYAAAHLLVRSVEKLHDSFRGPRLCVRVLPDRIERVVFGRVSPRRLQPGTLYYRNGRRVSFVGLRWQKESVVLLLPDGTREVKISEISEVHLPRIDPWRAYYRELATLSPACLSRLMRIETTGGLIATVGALRFVALPYGMSDQSRAAGEHIKRLDAQIANLESKWKANRLKLDRARENYLRAPDESDKQTRASALKRRFEEEIKRWKVFVASIESARSRRASARGPGGDAGTWLHILQPVWSLDPLRVPFARVRMRWSFAPARVPFYRVRPAATVGPPLLPMHANRNSAGRALRSGGDEYAWGFAVHAYSELRFPLPKCAKVFRSRIGLDHIVGAGGCARGRVYVGSTAGKALYESPLLVGSKKTVDTGAVRLPPEGPRLLVLQADPANRRSPPGADPSNIRDKLDWLDPLLELDTSGLQDEVNRYIGPLLAASPGWKLKLDGRGVYIRTKYLYKPKKKSGTRRFLTMIRAQGQPLRLIREMKIGPADKWLGVHVSLSTGEDPGSDAVVLRVGGRRVGPQKRPIRQYWQGWAAPFLFGLDESQGKAVTLELTQGAGGKPLHWQAVKISKELPRAYHLERILKMAGQSNLQIPRVLGSALQSPRMENPERIALVEIYRHGGIMNFSSSTLGKPQPKDLTNVLVGADWKGGDKTFTAFRKTPSLKSLTIVKDSGVSSAAVDKLLTLMPGLKVEQLERLPSYKGAPCTFWMQNRTGKKVGIYWIALGGKLSLRDTLDNTGNRKRHYSYAGCLFEAHLDGKRISKFTVAPGRIWEIRPPGK